MIGSTGRIVHFELVGRLGWTVGGGRQERRGRVRDRHGPSGGCRSGRAGRRIKRRRTVRLMHDGGQLRGGLGSVQRGRGGSG